MTPQHPTMIDAADKLTADQSAAVDSWWFTARLHTDDTVLWAKIHTLVMPDTCHSTVSLLQEPDGHGSQKQATESLDEVTLPIGSLDARTSILTITGDLDTIEIAGTTDTASLQLTLHRKEPVLYNGGSGVFPLLGGSNAQYALPGLTTSGTLTTDGTTRHVSGRTWFDRQWGTLGSGQPTRATWLGIDLGAGRYLSVWDTTQDGTAWLTELKPDGTHTLTHAQRTVVDDGTWTLTVPSLDASLDITHRPLPDSHDGLYAGVCTVTGTLDGHDITGHGYTDILG
ncbi:lipocalin-like domain-containing protein [Streptomyces bobili]|uniref:lipocalin-like domain-containing protein n=1 Tax=Streptomyces bobili TaxID=67280 RepID=UPI003654DDC6